MEFVFSATPSFLQFLLHGKGVTIKSETSDFKHSCLGETNKVIHSK